MSLRTVLARRVRGVRIVNLVALTVLLTLAVTSYALKTLAEAQGVDTADVQTQITQEGKRIRLLKAELSHLESPGRVETLSTQYLGLAAVDPKHEIDATDLPRIAQSASASEPKTVTP